MQGRDDGAVVIPFRLGSERFPRKALCQFRGKTLVEHGLHNGRALADLLGLSQLVLTGPAEDLEQVQQTVDLEPYGALALPSASNCRCATDRLVELHPRLAGDLLVSLPIDEPTIEMHEIQRALGAPDIFDGVGAVTFYCDFFAPEDYHSPLSAKVVLDRRGRLLYLSRGLIPAAKNGTIDPSALKKNVGAFVFTRAFLEELAASSAVPTTLDRHEGLEQLRWLELGLAVRCLEIRHIGFGIDVPAQLETLERRTRR